MESSKRRTIPGSSSFCGWQPLDSNEFTDLFAAQEIIEQNSKLGLSSSKIFKVPHGVEEETWIYEHFRNFLCELTGFILHFKTCCTSTTDPTMKIEVNGEEMLFLCNLFSPALSIPAIDYMLLTVAQATAQMNDVDMVPSRNNISRKVVKEIKTMVRRIYRIFAFCFYVHRKEFDEYEKKTQICGRFTKFLMQFDLMDKKGYYIPASYWESTM